MPQGNDVPRCTFTYASRVVASGKSRRAPSISFAWMLNHSWRKVNSGFFYPQPPWALVLRRIRALHAVMRVLDKLLLSTCAVSASSGHNRRMSVGRPVRSKERTAVERRRRKLARGPARGKHVTLCLDSLEIPFRT
jgi:hypothetical protein